MHGPALRRRRRDGARSARQQIGRSPAFILEDRFQASSNTREVGAKQPAPNGLRVLLVPGVPETF